MEVAGLCSICGRPGVLQTCRECGAHACGEHFDFRKALCMPCSGRAGIGVR